MANSRLLLFPLFLFLFFPYIGIIPGIDVQPLFFLYAALTLALFAYKLNVSVTALIGFLVIYGLIVMRFLFEIEYLTPNYFATYSMSVLTPIFIYILISNKILFIKRKYVVWAIVLYVFVGFIQVFYPTFLAGLVARSTEQIKLLEQTGRGVRSLASEPSNFGKMLASLNILWVFFLFKSESIANSEIPKVSLIGSVGLLLSSAILAQSAYAVGFHLVLISLLLVVLGKGKYVFSLSAILVTILVVYDTVLSEADSRIFFIFQALLNNPEFIMQQGAFKRLMNIPISINNTLEFGILGAGNSPLSYPTSILTMFGWYEYNAVNRNFGGFVEYMLKFGILSLPVYVIYGIILYRIGQIKAYINGQKYRIGLFLSLALFIYSFQDGSPVNPLIWFMLLYIYYHRGSLTEQKMKF